MFKKLLTVIIGVYLIGLGISIEIKANLGINALTLFFQGLGKQMGISLGTASMILLTLIPVLLIFIDKKRIGLGTFINGIFSGFIIDFHYQFFSNFTIDSILLKIIFMVAGITITAIGIGIYIAGELGEAGIDAIMILLANRLKIKIKYVRMVIDFILIVLGVIMGGSIGISTFASMLIYGIVIDRTLSIIKNIKVKLGASI